MINQDFFLALQQLEKEKGISQDEFITALETALVVAYKKHTGISSVVEEVVDPDKEISVEEAQEIKKSYKAGDVVSVEFSSKNFGRIAAQTAKQIIVQRLREIERQNTVSEFEEKEGELMACTVRRV